jgi:hypothetical protein
MAKDVSGSAARPLRHPVFLGALGLLVLNDHVLKGSAVPGWITGKLSDLAGLVVAPVLVAVALRALAESRRGPRETERAPGTAWHIDAAAMIGVSGVFVATELWQGAADAVASLAGWLGVPSRLVADPTDLLALAVLPLTQHVLAAGPRTPWPRAVGRAVFALGVLACVATAPRPPSWSTTAYVVNGLSEQVDVRLRWATLSLDCGAVGERTLSTIVAPEVLSTGSTFRLDPGDTIPLDDWAAAAARPGVDAGFGWRPGPGAGGGTGCMIALVAIDDLPDTLVLWSTDQTLTVPTRASAGALPTVGRVEISGSLAAPRLVTSADVRAEAYDDRTMPARCTLPAEVGASDPASFAGPAFVVAARSETTDGCVRLDLEMGARPLPFFVCAPTELVPFEVGDSVRIDESDSLGVRRIALVGGGRTLVLLRSRQADSGSASVIEGGVTIGLGALDACGGDRMDCGSFVAPHTPAISGGAAGEDARGIVRRTSTTGRAMQILVVRAETVVAASPRCREGRDEAGPLLDVVVLYE